MWTDEIIEQTRKAREEYGAKFEYDIEAIVADIKEKEKQSERPVVSLPRKQPVSVPLAKTS
jgi:polyhydroxyalkanoate synthesis regulator phasin